MNSHLGSTTPRVEGTGSLSWGLWGLFRTCCYARSLLGRGFSGGPSSHFWGAQPPELAEPPLLSPNLGNKGASSSSTVLWWVWEILNDVWNEKGREWKKRSGNPTKRSWWGSEEGRADRVIPGNSAFLGAAPLRGQNLPGSLHWSCLWQQGKQPVMIKKATINHVLLVESLGICIWKGWGASSVQCCLQLRDAGWTLNRAALKEPGSLQRFPPVVGGWLSRTTQTYSMQVPAVVHGCVTQWCGKWAGLANFVEAQQQIKQWEKKAGLTLFLGTHRTGRVTPVLVALLWICACLDSRPVATLSKHLWEWEGEKHLFSCDSTKDD